MNNIFQEAVSNYEAQVQAVEAAVKANVSAIVEQVQQVLSQLGEINDNQDISFQEAGQQALFLLVILQLIQAANALKAAGRSVASVVKQILAAAIKGARGAFGQPIPGGEEAGDEQ